MKIKIVSSDCNNWYKNCIGEIFPVHSESRKGGRGKWVVNIPHKHRHLTNGHMYGWIEKDDCKILEIYQDEIRKYNIHK